MNTDRYHQPFTFDRTVRLVISTAIIFGAVMLIKHLSGVLLPFFIACIMAYVIHPFIEFLDDDMFLYENLEVEQ